MLQDKSINFNILMEKSKAVINVFLYANLICRLLTSQITVASNEKTFSKL